MLKGLALSHEDAPAWLFDDFPAGVGLVRGEYILRDLQGYVSLPEVRTEITDYLIRIARRAAPKPVWYRTFDLDAGEAATLTGVEERFLEKVPHLGTRGIRRGLRFPDALIQELTAVRAAQEECPNLRVLFSFVTTVEEADAAAAFARKVGIEHELGLMAETPAAVLTLPEMFRLGFGHVLVGCNDLWALTMADVRRPGNWPTAQLGLVRMVELARKYTREHGVPLHMAGYLDESLRAMAEDIGVDALVCHYSQLPSLLGDRYAELPDLDRMADIKRRSRAAVAALRDVPVVG
jgi:phosphoenolpyruvate-protein kinase (PTS system EI component)